ncbi:ATP-binding cassette domain-containing protein [Actinomadura viridis]|uniref:ATP-binding cassette domain-containing protein n=1 Tax=Actinomadura viridis TaxID=58110 RepID=UPI0036CB6A3B
MKAPVIEVRDLRVRRGGRDVVGGVSFTVAEGGIYALLGRYGTGKTAVLEVVSGLRRPDGGTARVRGADPYDARGGLRAAAVWRDGGLFPGLTVAEVVDTWRRWTLDPLTGEEALRLTGLEGMRDVPFHHLTAVHRRLLDLALVLVGRSDVLFLDEPTSGLEDGAARGAVWHVLRRLSGAGVTVLLTTRDPAEACRADHAGILNEAEPAGGGATLAPWAA